MQDFEYSVENLHFQTTSRTNTVFKILHFQTTTRTNTVFKIVYFQTTTSVQNLAFPNHN